MVRGQKAENEEDFPWDPLWEYILDEEAEKRRYRRTWSARKKRSDAFDDAFKNSDAEGTYDDEGEELRRVQTFEDSYSEAGVVDKDQSRRSKRFGKLSWIGRHRKKSGSKNECESSMEPEVTRASFLEKFAKKNQSRIESSQNGARAENKSETGSRFCFAGWGKKKGSTEHQEVTPYGHMESIFKMERVEDDRLRNRAKHKWRQSSRVGRQESREDIQQTSSDEISVASYLFDIRDNGNFRGSSSHRRPSTSHRERRQAERAKRQYYRGGLKRASSDDFSVVDYLFDNRDTSSVHSKQSRLSRQSRSMVMTLFEQQDVVLIPGSISFSETSRQSSRRRSFRA
jgi:hypothetical protein